jgi:NAD(P)H-flavin reductase
VTLLYGARTPALLVYRELLERWRAAAPALTIQYFAETGADGTTVADGRLSCQAVFYAARDPQHTLFYFSGPPAMLNYFTEQMHTAHGIARECLRIDAWE